MVAFHVQIKPFYFYSTAGPPRHRQDAHGEGHPERVARRGLPAVPGRLVL